MKNYSIPKFAQKYICYFLTLLLFINMNILGVSADTGENGSKKAHVIVMNLGSPYMTIDGIRKDIVNGKEVKPVFYKGSTLVPVRAVIEGLGGTVSWYEKNQSMSIKLDGNEVYLWLESTTAYVNNIRKVSDVAPQIIESSIMIPANLIADNLGCSVKWEPGLETITIIKPYTAKNYLDEVVKLSHEQEKLEEQSAMEQIKSVCEKIIENCDGALQTSLDKEMYWKFLYYKGVALSDLVRNDEALECLMKASESARYLDNDEKKAYESMNELAKMNYYLGREYMIHGKMEEAVQYVGKVVSNNGYINELKQDKAFESIRNTDEYKSLVGVALVIDNWPQYTCKTRVKNGKVLASVGEVAIGLGADVDFDKATNKITITKLRTVATLQVGSETAKVNGKDVNMGVAPIILDSYYKVQDKDGLDEFLIELNNRIRMDNILVPLEFVSNLLGQKVTWKDDVQVYNDLSLPGVVISEDLSNVKYTEQQRNWAIATYLTNTRYNGGQYNVITGKSRDEGFTISLRKALEEGWGIRSREDFFHMVDWLKKEGHNKAYEQLESQITDEKFEELKKIISANPEVVPSSLKFYVKNRDRLKGKGLIGWDYSRIVGIAGWSYVAGYISIEEAYDISIEAARVIQKTYSSWEDMAEGYILGFEFWSGVDDPEQDPELYKRYLLNQKMLKDPKSPWVTLPWDLTLDAK